MIVIFGKDKKMKTSATIILALSMAIAYVLTTALPCGAAEKEQKDIWSDDEPRIGPKRWELTAETIKRVMSRLAETNPARAKELERLREKNPEKFKAEIRRVMHEQFGKRFKEQMGQKPGPKPGPGQVRAGPRRGGPAREPRETMRERMRERHTEYLEWLEKNYPEEAKKLAELKEKKPELYMRQLMLGLRKYGKIFEASKENPKLAEVLKEDLILKQKRDKLLGKIKTAGEDDKRKELTEQLEEIVSDRFDLIVKRKQIAYEQLRKELEELKERVKQSEADVERWKELKDEKVKERLKELINLTEKFNWS